MVGDYNKGRSIEPGDMLLVEPSKEVRDGDVVFARHRENGVTIKRFFRRENGGVELRPINPDYKSIIRKPREPVVVYRVSAITTKL